MAMDNKNKMTMDNKAGSKTDKIYDSKTGKLAAILIRGFVKLPKDILDTLQMLNLGRKHTCIVVENNSANAGMLNKVKDYITWGEIDDQTFQELIDKRGQEYQGREKDSKGLYNYKMLAVNGRKYKKYFRLNPPRKGFGRKGIKVSFRAGGSLGYRGNAINDLIKRML